MPPPSSNSRDSKGKKQASLTSFFSPKSSPASQPSQPREAPASSPLRPSLPTGRKRPLQEDADRANNGPEKPKRQKAVRRVVDDEDLQEDLEPTPQSETRPQSETGQQSSQRTDYYLFGSSQDPDVDPEVLRKREELHNKFVRKLGRPDGLLSLRRNHSAEIVPPAGEEDAEDDGEEEEEAPPPPKAKKGAKGGKSGKLTPMEMQFLDIKRKHMDTVLIFEVGYKFRFFGEDARIASKALSIMCIPGKYRYDEHPSEAHLTQFASASIPVPRLPVHAKRLVAAGYKVGVVRQIETAALKKAGDNRNAPFVRKLTNVYTKGTYVDEIGELDESTSGAPSGGYLLCITESPSKGGGADEKVDVGILAVQPATGDIIFDSFEDGFMRSEIETRLLHISPCEFLIVGELTKGTDKLIQHLSGSSTNVFGDRSRVERVPRSKTMATEAQTHVTQFYADKVKNSSQDERASTLLDKVLQLPEHVTVCLSAMITHLTEYGLEHIFDLTKYFQSFSTRTHMLINGTTLESLEVYRNATDHSEKGSLLWALDKTLTRFGQRLLRKWVGRPLLDKQALEARVEAVEELLENKSSAKVNQLETLLAATKADLERSLIRIYYGKCTRPELLSVLQTMQRLATHFSHVQSPEDTGFKSPLISDAICSLPLILDTVISYLDKINPDAAKKDDKINFFREEEQTDAIQDNLVSIASVEQELDAHKKVAAEKLGRKVPVSYVTVAGIEYLVEVGNADVKRVPASWVKISGTKKLSRFHTPDVVRMMNERDRYKEALAAACEDAFKDLLSSIAADYQPLRDAISSLATLDCLLSLSKVASMPGYTKPTFLPDTAPPSISITGGRHPVAEHTLPDGYIPFNSSLASPSPTAYLITGPNMGGKSSFVRAVALLVLLAQIGSFVPATSLTLTLTDAIHTRMGAKDNLFAGESTFMVELSETSRILRSCTPNSLVILDELGRGTSTHDGVSIAHAVLAHVATAPSPMTLFITHYQNLSRLANTLPIQNVHMRFTSTTAAAASPSRPSDGDMDGKGEGDAEEEITFLYEVTPGVAHRSYGLNVARLARIPRKIVDVAGVKSREMETNLRARRLGATASALGKLLRGDGGKDELDHLIEGIEEL
ncbi:related to DNA mismatch repair protein [Cephalotrichum gorgonifer]|uniref:MutS protein homolog 3 n=1 Tax=Cephalotrichum gorgonifer TaxID=2041049 RepID=A0AAE8MNY9_9PEZI|nr:related to DNA mismatch repair protein [Cephalotrichum gorgonifer]